MKIITSIALLLLLTGCDQQQMVQKLSSPQDQAVAKHYIYLLAHHDFNEIERNIDASLKDASLHQSLLQMAAAIPAERPKSVRVVGAQSFHNASSTTINTTFEYEFAGKWLLINVAIKKAGGDRTIVGFNVVPRAQSLEAENRFSLFGKSAAHYAVLAAAVAALALSLFALVVCIKSNLACRKWPWLLFIIFGIGRLWINWSTGQWGLQLLSIQLFSASAVAPLYGPWVVAVSLPLGAIVFLLRRATLAEPVPER